MNKINWSIEDDSHTFGIIHWTDKLGADKHGADKDVVTKAALPPQLF